MAQSGWLRMATALRQWPSRELSLGVAGVPRPWPRFASFIAPTPQPPLARTADAPSSPSTAVSVALPPPAQLPQFHHLVDLHTYLDQIWSMDWGADASSSAAGHGNLMADHGLAVLDAQTGCWPSADAYHVLVTGALRQHDLSAALSILVWRASFRGHSRVGPSNTCLFFWRGGRGGCNCVSHVIHVRVATVGHASTATTVPVPHVQRHHLGSLGPARVDRGPPTPP